MSTATADNNFSQAELDKFGALAQRWSALPRRPHVIHHGVEVSSCGPGPGGDDLVWLGRRRLAGVEPGRRVRVAGFVTSDRGRTVIYNPRYELLPQSTDVQP